MSNRRLESRWFCLAQRAPKRWRSPMPPYSLGHPPLRHSCGNQARDVNSGPMGDIMALSTLGLSSLVLGICFICLVMYTVLTRHR